MGGLGLKQHTGLLIFHTVQQIPEGETFLTESPLQCADADPGHRLGLSAAPPASRHLPSARNIQKLDYNGMR